MRFGRLGEISGLGQNWSICSCSRLLLLFIAVLHNSVNLNRINAKMRFFSANERSKGEGKGKEEEGKGRGRKGERGRRKGKGNWNPFLFLSLSFSLRPFVYSKSSATLLYVGAPAAKLLMLPFTLPASVFLPFFSTNPSLRLLFCSLLSIPSSSLPSQPIDVCWFVNVVSLTRSSPLRGGQQKSRDWRWSRCDWRPEVDAVGAQVSALMWHFAGGHGSP